MSNSVQIRNKKVRIEIKNGEERIGEIVFNPEDTRIYARFIEIMESLHSGNRDIGKIDLTSEELDGKLETLEDFDKAVNMFDKIKRATNITVETWENVCKGFDELFGEGVCECFTQGDLDPELLLPMIEVVTPYFSHARKSKKEQYKRLNNE